MARTLQDLPLELVSIMVDYVDQLNRWDERISACAVISRTWHIAVESRTFSSLKLSATDLEQMARIMTPSRQACLKEMAFEPAGQPDNTERRKGEGRRTSCDEQTETNRVFTDSIVDFLTLLRAWGDQVEVSKNTRQLSLRLSGDGGRILDPWFCNPPYWFNRFTPQPVRLLPCLLPAVPRVSHLSLSLSLSVNPEAVATILRAFPNLSDLSWDQHIEDFELHPAPEQASLYSGFIKALSDIPFNHLTSIDLHLGYLKENFDTHPADPEPTHKGLSSCLGALSQSPHVQVLDIKAPGLDTCIFGPKDSHEYPLWPCLRRCTIILTDWEIRKNWGTALRAVVGNRATRAGDFFGEAASAARFMPRLETFVVCMELEDENGFMDFGITYRSSRAAGNRSERAEASLELEIGALLYELPESIVEAWRRLAIDTGAPSLSVEIIGSDSDHESTDPDHESTDPDHVSTDSDNDLADSEHESTDSDNDLADSEHESTDSDRDSFDTQF